MVFRSTKVILLNYSSYLITGLHKIFLFRYLILYFWIVPWECVNFSSEFLTKRAKPFIFLWQKLLSVTVIIYVTYIICSHIISFLLKKLLSVAETCFCDRNLFLWQKLVSVTCFTFLRLVLSTKFLPDLGVSIISDNWDNNFVEPCCET